MTAPGFLRITAVTGAVALVIWGITSWLIQSVCHVNFSFNSSRCPRPLTDGGLVLFLVSGAALAISAVIFGLTLLAMTASAVFSKRH